MYPFIYERKPLAQNGSKRGFEKCEALDRLQYNTAIEKSTVWRKEFAKNRSTAFGKCPLLKPLI